MNYSLILCLPILKKNLYDFDFVFTPIDGPLWDPLPKQSVFQMKIGAKDL